MDDLIRRQAAIEHWRLIIDATSTDSGYNMGFVDGLEFCISHLSTMPSAQPERKTGHWILDRSGAYCCNRCMEPCATYVMMKPRDKFCKMCGSRNEVME